jgi:hypothetical protein
MSLVGPDELLLVLVSKVTFHSGSNRTHDHVFYSVSRLWVLCILAETKVYKIQFVPHRKHVTLLYLTIPYPAVPYLTLPLHETFPGSIQWLSFFSSVLNHRVHRDQNLAVGCSEGHITVAHYSAVLRPASSSDSIHTVPDLNLLPACAGFVRSLRFSPENGGDVFLRNVWLSPSYTGTFTVRAHCATGCSGMCPHVTGHWAVTLMTDSQLTIRIHDPHRPTLRPFSKR